ncbi:MAG TPA: MFS transporter [Natronosporangium sp.]
MAGLGRSFHGLWAATGAANLGDGMALFALPLLALATGASAGGVAAVTVALTLAWPVAGLPAGWFVDRVDRRRLLAGANLTRAAVLAGLAVAYLTGTLSLPLILLAAWLIGIAETLIDTALTATIPLVVGPDQLTRANARVEATITVANQFIGPPLAGLLAAVTLGLTAGTSAALYALAAAAVLVIVLWRPNAPVAKQPGEPVLRAALAGLRYLWRHPVLRALTVFTASMNVVWAAATALLVVYAVRPGPLGLSPAAYGTMLTAMAAGGLLGAIAVPRLQQRFGTRALLVADCVGTVMLVLPVAAGAPALVVAAGVVIAGAGSSVWRILVATIRQQLSPPELLGRVYAASRVISWGVLPGGAALAGLGAELSDIRTVFWIATGLAVAVLVAFVGFSLRHDLSGKPAAPVPVG